MGSYFYLKGNTGEDYFGDEDKQEEDMKICCLTPLPVSVVQLGVPLEGAKFMPLRAEIFAGGCPCAAGLLAAL